VWLDVAAMAAILPIGKLQLRRFEPFMPWWRRVLKTLLLLAITAAVSRYFGRIGVAIGFALALLPVLYIHAIWLPRHGVNGCTAEPRKRYYELRGWKLN
jgi:hypothetical protein